MTSAASSSTRQGARPESCLRVRAVRASNNRVSQTVRASTGREAGSRVGAETREMEVWEDLRRQARTLEGDIDQKLIAFNRLSVSWEQVSLPPSLPPSLSISSPLHAYHSPETSHAFAACPAFLQAVSAYTGTIWLHCSHLHGMQQANGRGDEERDNLLHKGEHVSATLAAELDSYLFQVRPRLPVFCQLLPLLAMMRCCCCLWWYGHAPLVCSPPPCAVHDLLQWADHLAPP
jgi:hypothetical protein